MNISDLKKLKKERGYTAKMISEGQSIDFAKIKAALW